MSETREKNPFVFHTEIRLVELTGLKAGNLMELLQNLKAISGSSVFYHTHQYFLEHHFVESGFYNDFAKWVYEELREFRLGEKLNYIDFAAFKSVRQIRNELIRRIENHIAAQEFLRQAPSEVQFHFCTSKSFVLPTGKQASNPKELIGGIKSASTDSIFYHFVESRLRIYTTSYANDFSNWLVNEYGMGDLAAAIEKIDPYFISLEALREHILGALEGAV